MFTIASHHDHSLVNCQRRTCSHYSSQCKVAGHSDGMCKRERLTAVSQVGRLILTGKTLRSVSKPRFTLFFNELTLPCKPNFHSLEPFVEARSHQGWLVMAVNLIGPGMNQAHLCASLWEHFQEGTTAHSCRQPRYIDTPFHSQPSPPPPLMCYCPLVSPSLPSDPCFLALPT